MIALLGSELSQSFAHPPSEKLNNLKQIVSSSAPFTLKIYDISKKFLRSAFGSLETRPLDLFSQIICIVMESTLKLLVPMVSLEILEWIPLNEGTMYSLT